MRSGVGDNMYLDLELCTMTLCTAWRKLFVHAICILHRERTQINIGERANYT